MGKPQIRSPELAQLAKKLYEQLGNGNKVAQRLDISAPTAYQLLKDAGVDVPSRGSAENRQRRKILTGDKAKEAAADYAAGMSVVALKKKHGVGLWAIRTAASDAGVPLRNKGGRFRAFSEADRAEAIRLYKADWSQAQIAAAFGSTQTTVARMLKQAGCPPRRNAGERHNNWKGGAAEVGNGYIGIAVAPDDPFYCMAFSTGYVLAHRLVMARHLGRPLRDDETVHHINGDRTDYSLENLQLRQGAHGKGVVIRCIDCGGYNIEFVPLPDEINSGQLEE